ncbi:MAG: hypothetical protein WCP93_03215 [Candidatus Berkelbacteria bacterium]
MVSTINDLHLIAERTFSAEQLCKASVIVQKFILGQINQKEYDAQRDELAQKTSNPKLFAQFMDCHPAKGIKNVNKIQVLIP